MNNVYIKSISHYVPEGRITNNEILNWFKDENKDYFNNDDLEYMMYGNMRKLEFLGSSTRACCKNGDNSINMAVKVSNEAIQKAGLLNNQIDCIIFTAVSNPFREPSFATCLASQLGIEHSDLFDINDTCNGFLKGMEIASLYIKNGIYKNILIVTSENPYEMANKLKPIFKVDNIEEVDNIISYLFVGSGASAMMLSNEGTTKFMKYTQYKNSKDWDATLFINPYIEIPANRFGKKNKGIWADGRAISSCIIKDMPLFISKVLDEWDYKADDIDYVFIHQLGENITFATTNQLGIKKDKLPVNTFKEYGNMASANLPIGLSIADKKGFLKPGNSIMLMSSSCGISYSVVHIIW